MNVLIVEDERVLSELLEEELKEELFTVDCAGTVEAAKERISGNLYDLMLVDLGLPDGDGLELIALARAHGANPGIIILTARGELEDRIEGLEKGADDYLPKPFSIAELRARIHALIRRKFDTGTNSLDFGSLRINLDQREISLHGLPVLLTDTEFQILRYLALNKNRLVTRSALAEHIWGDRVDDRFSLDFINSHIKNLRKKLGGDELGGHIKTVYGAGYRFEWKD